MTALNELPNANEAVSWLITYASGFNPKHNADQPTESLWLSQLGHYDPNIIRAGIEAHYVRSELRRFVLEVGELATWCASASPPRERCPEHPSYYAGPSCGGCRSERLELGLEKPLGRSTVQQLQASAPVPPERVRALLSNSLKQA